MLPVKNFQQQIYCPAHFPRRTKIYRGQIPFSLIVNNNNIYYIVISLLYSYDIWQKSWFFIVYLHYHWNPLVYLLLIKIFLVEIYEISLYYWIYVVVVYPLHINFSYGSMVIGCVLLCIPVYFFRPAQFLLHPGHE